jgi:phage terminase small subunit
MATKQAKPRSKVKPRRPSAAKRPAKKVAKKATKPVAKPVAKPVKRKVAQGRPTVKAREARITLFVQEYLKANFNGTKAAIAVGYSPTSARVQASELLATPEVQALLDVAIAERAERVKIDADDVLKRMYAVATADPRELIELHRCCCRFCYGIDHHYQWTPNELREATMEYQKQVACANADQLKLLREPDTSGGTEFNPYTDPNPACPECFGEGTERVVPKDTRDLSPSAMLLYAGVKTTQNGLEIRMHDQTSMLVNVGKHLGMFEKKVTVKGEITHRNKTLNDILDEVDGSGTGLPTNGTAD